MISTKNSQLGLESPQFSMLLKFLLISSQKHELPGFNECEPARACRHQVLNRFESLYQRPQRIFSVITILDFLPICIFFLLLYREYLSSHPICFWT